MMALSVRGAMATALPALLTLVGCGGSTASTFDQKTALGTENGNLGGDNTSGLGDGGVTTLAAAAGACGGDGGVLEVTIRDFKMSTMGGVNPDFENAKCCLEMGIVLPTLGADGTPVYGNHPNGTQTTHGAMWFDQWYHDTPGVNITVVYPLQLTTGAAGTCGYDSLVSGVPTPNSMMPLGWFPIDDGTPYATAFGNQGEPHNYSFTTELHTVFTYQGGETFSFSGDDDVFVFIDKLLVIDLGGVHVRTQKAVMLDTLGLTLGQLYPLDIFNAERKTVQSNFSFTTTLALQPPPPR